MSSHSLVNAPVPSGIVLALMLSIFVHVVISQLLLHWRVDRGIATLVDTPSIRARLRPNTRTPQAASDAELRPIQIQVSKRQAPLPRPRIGEAPARPEIPLNPEIERPFPVPGELLRDLPDQSQPNEDTRHTLNGAVVMDGELFTRLNRSPTRLGIATGDLDPDADHTWGGGAWNDFVRIGKRCFVVQQADPLDPIAHPLWFGTACPETNSPHRYQARQP